MDEDSHRLQAIRPTVPNFANILLDDGAGVSADELPRLRERFFRGRRHNDVGSGLGLSIVDLAAVQSGFVLTVEPGTAAGLRAIVEIPPARVR